MTQNQNIDVAHLPTIGFDNHAPLWWGQIGMMVIEGTIFLILIASYFYVRIGFQNWPPPDIEPPALLLPTINFILLLVSCIPMYWTGEAAMKRDRRGTILWMVVTIVICVVFLIIRTIEFNRFNFKWTTDIYGSFVWTMMGLHTMHAIADTIQTVVLLAIVLSRRVNEKQQLGIKVDGIYWYFVVIAWIPLYALIYIYPNLLKG